MIRRAVGNDAAEIAACVADAYRHYIHRIGQPPGPTLEDYGQVITEREVFVTELDQQIIGVLVLTQTEEGFLLDNIAVDPTHQGKSIGQQLLALAEARAKESGYDFIYLYTNAAMTENLNMYKRIGYEAYAHRREKGLSRVYMRKRFSNAAV